MSAAVENPTKPAATVEQVDSSLSLHQWACLRLSLVKLKSPCTPVLFWWLLLARSGQHVSVKTAYQFGSATRAFHRTTIYRSLLELEEAKLVKQVGGNIFFTIPNELDEELVRDAEYSIRLTPERRPKQQPVQEPATKQAEHDVPMVKSDLGNLTRKTSKRSNPPNPKKKPRETLSPEHITLICSSQINMERWLLWGLPGVKEPDTQHPASSTNWRQFIKGQGWNPEVLNINAWTIPAFAGFFWFQVSRWREARGLPQGMPKFERLMGDLKNLLRQLGSKWALANYIIVATYNFDLIACAVGRIADHMNLDEQVLSHASFRAAIVRYGSLNDEQRPQFELQYQDAQIARSATYPRNPLQGPINGQETVQRSDESSGDVSGGECEALSDDLGD